MEIPMSFKTKRRSNMKRTRLEVGMIPVLILTAILVGITGCQKADSAHRAGKEERKTAMYAYADTDEKTQFTTPPIDAEAPAHTETATFAMG